jgi:hypothetical protein
LQTYLGAVHGRCGTTERYASNGGCVHCSRIIATEQREARKYLKRLAAEEAEQKIRDDDGLTIDSVAEDGLDADDAEARREASFDELM